MHTALTENWILMALIASAAWALSCVVDVLFVSRRVYRGPADGPLIAGLFCSIPAMLSAGAAQPDTLSVTAVAVTMASAIAFLSHVYCYFKALFALNDAVNAEIVNTLGVVTVPVLAFVFLGERLSPLHYLAVTIAAFAVLFLVQRQAGRIPGRAIGYLAGSVFCLSAMMVLQAYVLARVQYVTVIFLFSATVFAAVVFVLIVRREQRASVVRMSRRFSSVFVGLQLLEIGAVSASQRATDLSPAVSLVALVECSVPLFIMALSALIAAAIRWSSAWPTNELRSTLDLQTRSAPSKFGAMLMIVAAIFLTSA